MGSAIEGGIPYSELIIFSVRIPNHTVASRLGGRHPMAGPRLGFLCLLGAFPLFKRSGAVSKRFFSAHIGVARHSSWGRGPGFGLARHPPWTQATRTESLLLRGVSRLRFRSVPTSRKAPVALSLLVAVAPGLRCCWGGVEVERLSCLPACSRRALAREI